MNIRLLLASAAMLVVDAGLAQPYNEPYRPQVHFSQKAHWMNDPNGMVYVNGTYHLFFQYYPGAMVWGPMHWGHATSTDLMHWKEQPIALYPDKLGYIFSGSIVVDKDNTAGFGKGALVAIYTNHDPEGEKKHTNVFQNQSIAYSTDGGFNWKKYAGNPVVKNPGITDFRDPKVSWYAPRREWILTLAVKDHIAFYSSPDLKNWKHESDFGLKFGAHGGVWECPDLLQFGNEWALIVNINPGGPQGGSATQYFTGHFDGSQFTTDQAGTKWLDWGADEYAGVTFSNIGDRKVFLGWMGNWNYAQKVPTSPWRSAMTLPRELRLERVNGQYYLASRPVPEIRTVEKAPLNLPHSNGVTIPDGPSRIVFVSPVRDFQLTLSNTAGEKFIIGFDARSNRYFMDRRLAGEHSFGKDFAAVHYAPRISTDKEIAIELLVDKASAELFADNGLTTMTDIFFPKTAMRNLAMNGTWQRLDIIPLKSIWRK